MTGQDTTNPLRVVTIELQGTHFALETQYVREILDLGPMTEVPNASPFVNRLINVRGKVVPLADLRLRLGLEQGPPTIDSRIIVMDIELDGTSSIVGILADKVHEVTELAATALTQTPKLGLRCRPEHVRCIGKRADDFIIVLDPPRIFASALSEPPPSPAH
ncbi:chemotaxis protein CheW [Paracraurococcus lichenis]|uniref:Chemotaxis protein CheW n=1 Tax=Paracraurococcus lichenis TaxID=3064888 RepID=A0ABT9E4D0_9PROT|nr:chemotaxis protein CheW [Paracraurococcus sp. LOR1-02]MDO9710930.1 chemotaxis protein CheW [Paracraurococcus sp. LOR1-02]